MNHPPKKHPFLDDLDDEVILETNLLDAPVVGKKDVLQVIKKTGGLYASQNPVKHITDNAHDYFEYEAVLKSSETVFGIASIQKNQNGRVIKLRILFGPLNGATRLAINLNS